MSRQMVMKVSDLILDMATGDASAEDVHIQEALGRINVSSSIFEAAYNISELPSEDISFVQEAADKQGLPTDKEGSVGVSVEAVNQELEAYFDLVIATAKKVKSTAVKSLALLRNAGKKLGVSQSSDFLAEMSSLTQAFSQAYPKGMKLDGDSGFLKSKYAARMAESYCTGMVNILGGYGLEISSVFEDKVVKQVADLSNWKKALDLVKSDKPELQLRNIYGMLNRGGKQLSFDKMLSRNMHYTDNVTGKDLASFGVAVYTLIAVSDAVAKQASQKKAVIAKVREIVSSCTNSHRVTRSCEDINDGVKEWSTNLNSLTTNIAKGFNDSIYGMTKAVTKKK